MGADGFVKVKSATILTIAGSDSGAGAGIQSDLRTAAALGGYALSVVTAVTAQNTQGVKSVNPVSNKVLQEQLRAVLEDYALGAVKTGLIPNHQAVLTIAAHLKKCKHIPLIIDPVIRSSSGKEFLNAKALATLKKHLIPRALLVTPNIPEAELLSGIKIKTEADRERAALEILKLGCSAVLIKGGHVSGTKCTDLLVVKNGKRVRFTGPRIVTRNSHGTGCVLSSAIAFQVAQGDSLPGAVKKAKAFLSRQLLRGKKVVWGTGHGPAFGLAS